MCERELAALRSVRRVARVMLAIITSRSTYPAPRHSLLHWCLVHVARRAASWNVVCHV